MAAQRLRLRAGDRARVAERRPVGGYAGDGQDARAVALDQGRQALAGQEFGVVELGGLRGRASHQVGDTQAVAGQQVLAELGLAA